MCYSCKQVSVSWLTPAVLFEFISQPEENWTWRLLRTSYCAMSSESPQVYADKFCWIQKGVKWCLVNMWQGIFWRSEQFIKAVAWYTANLLKVFLLLGDLSSMYQEHKYRVFLLRKKIESSWLLLILISCLVFYKMKQNQAVTLFCFLYPSFMEEANQLKEVTCNILCSRMTISQFKWQFKKQAISEEIDWGFLPSTSKFFPPLFTFVMKYRFHLASKRK